jgi:hypothetical protein
MAVRFSTIHRWDFCRALYRSHYNNKIVLSATAFFHDAPQLHHFDNKIYVTRINFLLIVKKISFFDKFAQ